MVVNQRGVLLMNGNKGLAKAEYVYWNRETIAKHYKAAGKKIAGYFCCYPPSELMTALGYVPFRIIGDMDEPLTEADNYLPTVMCYFYRSIMDIGIKGKYDYIDAFVGSHACDGAERVSYIWRSYIKNPCSYYLDVPHTDHDAALGFFKSQIMYMKEVLEATASKKATIEDIQDAIKTHNEQRSLVRWLYGLNKADQPLITGTEMLKVMVSIMSLSPEDGNQLLKEVIKEVTVRSDGPRKKTGRILVWGSLIDNVAFTNLIETCDLNIVIDDTAIGTRSFWADVDVLDDPYEALAIRYLKKIVCPRTFRDTKSTRLADVENRFAYLGKMVKDWNINGVYMNIIRNCDIHGYEIPEVRDYFESMGLSTLVIEQDYATTALEPLRTRFQAFAESLE